MPSKSVALALSGGGHRATLFTLGALMYVVDAGRARDTSSIASVSGGSLTNGFLAQTLDFQTTDSAAFERNVVAPLAGQIAQRGTLFVPWLSKLYLLLLAAGLPAAFLPIWCLQAGLGWRVLAVFGLLMVWGWIAGKRGWICGQAFRSTLFAPGGKTTRLQDIETKVSHVICSTELRTAQSVYFAGDFVYAFAFGPGEPGGMPLYQAVQASAAFPGGFPPARIDARRHKFQGPLSKKETRRDVKDLILTDGGVYDNMGDQWARGFRQRAAVWPWLAKQTQPDQLVVVNASARVPWSPFRRGRIPLLGELLAFMRVTDIMYINTTNVRRQDIVRSYDPADPDRPCELPGVLVQIAQSPFDVATGFAGSRAPAVAARAAAVIAALGVDTRATWSEIARQNSEVATTLSKLRTEVSARLLYQGYVTAMCNLHVVFGDPDSKYGGWPLLAVPPLDRFTNLASSHPAV
jgi:predicted acylesterase/phospholipase RssA